MKYTVYKLGRKQDPENKRPSMLYNGFQFSGATIRTKKVNPEETEYITGMDEPIGKLEDLVGHSAYFSGYSMYDFVRTSIVRHVYEHGDTPEINLQDGFPEVDL